jgi:hypothetical protein
MDSAQMSPHHAHPHRQEVAVSRIDSMYEEVFGERLAKSGAAFERFAAIAMHVVLGGVVKADARLRGEWSKSVYQIDALQSDGVSCVMGEAKDYTTRANRGRVGRDDLQRLAGALADLDGIDKGAFFSATGYTGPARKYAGVAGQMPAGKPIDLFHLDDFCEDDLAGRIRRICVIMHLCIPMPEPSSFQVVLSDMGFNKLREMNAGPDDFERVASWFHDANGNPATTIAELTSQGYGEVDPETKIASGCYLLDDQYLLVKGVPVSVCGLAYSVPHHFDTIEMDIEDSSTHRLTLRDSSGNLLKVLSDRILQGYRFGSDGQVVGPEPDDGPPESSF